MLMHVQCRFHLLHPDYILNRMKQLCRAFRLVVLIVHVDVEDVVKPLADITKAAINNEVTLVCAWSHQVRGGVDRLGDG